MRFTLSYRDVEELLAERGLDISYETVRCWVLKFGPVIARRLCCCRPRPSNLWHLDAPSQGLAPLVVCDLARVVRDLCESGVTILLIEQNMKLAEEVADRLAIMVKERIV